MNAGSTSSASCSPTNGEYVAGPTMRGPKAIAEGLRRTFAGNSLGLAEPNFHVLFNERITLAGAKAVSIQPVVLRRARRRWRATRGDDGEL